MRTALAFALAPCLLVATACARTELASPKTGSCSEATASNRWPQFDGTGGEPPLVTETGWGEGQVPPDFELLDQFEEPICLWQMVGRYVVLDTSTLWCEPCQKIAATLACQQQKYGDDVAFMTFMVQDFGGQPADVSHAQEWSEAFGLGEGTLTPVIADGGQVFTSQFPGDGTFPTLILLDPELKVAHWGVGEETEVEIRARLEAELGVSVDECAAQ
jgi:thiol-disulfide isomerase/thioredoxin